MAWSVVGRGVECRDRLVVVGGVVMELGWRIERVLAVEAIRCGQMGLKLRDEPLREACEAFELKFKPVVRRRSARGSLGRGP